MTRVAFLTIALISTLAIGCGDTSSTAAKGPPCDLDVENLSGEFISLKGGGSGKDVPDTDTRVKFVEEDGKKKAIFVAGRLVPNNPATDKYTYEYVKKMEQGGDVLYSVNLFKGKSMRRIERLKKDNRNNGLKFEGRIYVKVNPRLCALSITDMYATWVKGEMTEDSNPSGTRTYIKKDAATPAFSFVKCTDARMLWPFAEESPDIAKTPPLELNGGVFKNEPVWLHYVEPPTEDMSDEEAAKKLVEWGMRAEEGCTYDFELWKKDHPWGDKVVVTPGEDGTIAWKKQVTFTSAPQNGMFVEMHRYKTCGGKRTLISNACNVVAPEPERTAEEKAKAAEEAKKK